MATDTFAATIARVRTKLQDTHKDFFDDDELKGYLVEGQTDFCKRTRPLRGLLPIIARENIETYDFPEDYLDLIRMEDEDGTQLENVSWNTIQELYGNDWRATTGTPTHIFSDLSGDSKQFQFYPRPNPPADTSGSEFATWNMQSENYCPETTIYGMCRQDSMICLFGAQNIYIYDGYVSTKTLRKTIDTALSIAARKEVAIVEPGTAFTNRSMIWAQVGTTLLYLTDLTTSVTTLLKTTAQNIHGLAPAFGGSSSTYHGRYFIYHNSTNTYWVSLVSVTAGTLITSVIFDNAVVTQSGTMYLSCNANGVYKIVAPNTPPTAPVATQVSTTRCKGIASANALNTIEGVAVDVYFNMNGAVYDGYDPTTANLIYDGIETTSPLYYDGGENIFCFNDLIDEYNFIGSIRIADGTLSTISMIQPPGGDVNIQHFLAANGWLYYASAISAYGLFSTDNELGDIVYKDAEPFESEQGGLIDVVDEDYTTVISFADQEGAVVNINNDVTSYLLWYYRLPRTDALELDSDLPAYYYCLWQCYIKDDDTASAQKAMTYFQLYEREIQRQAAKKRREYANSGYGRPKIHLY